MMENKELQVNILKVATRDGEELIANGLRYTFIHGDFEGNVIMEIGLVRTDGVREVPHATRRYYVDVKGEITYLTYAHC